MPRCRELNYFVYVCIRKYMPRRLAVSQKKCMVAIVLIVGALWLWRWLGARRSDPFENLGEAGNDARALAARLCRAGADIGDIQGQEPIKTFVEQKAYGIIKETGDICIESRRKWRQESLLGDNQAKKYAKSGSRDWKLCRNSTLRVTRPRQIGLQCCKADTSDCLQMAWVANADGVAKAQRAFCKKSEKPSCGGGATAKCVRPAVGSRFQWECPERRSGGGNAEQEYGSAGRLRCPKGDFVTSFRPYEKDGKAMKALEIACASGKDAEFGHTRGGVGGGTTWSSRTIENPEGFNYINVSVNEDGGVVRGMGAVANGGEWVQHGNMDGSKQLGCPQGKRIVGAAVTAEKGGGAIRSLKVLCG
jgi:hypothetical protein